MMSTKILLKQIKCYDNGGKTFDRYTVILNSRGDYVAMSENPFSPQGFGQHGEKCRAGAHLGRRISFDDLPVDCRKLVRGDLFDSVSEDCPGGGVAIVDEDGDVVRSSKNLAGIMVHARLFRDGVKLAQDGKRLLVNYPNGDHCKATFSDPNTLSEFISDRVRFGRGRFEFAEANLIQPAP